MRYRTNHEPGEQYWNADETAGYEITRRVLKHTVAHPEDLKPLGNAEPLYAASIVPFWVIRALFG